MAILTGINTRLKGSAGDWTFSQSGGRTVAKQKMAKKDNPRRSFAQMQRRVLWANLVNVFRAFDGNLKPSFEGKAAGISDFNMFMAANIGTSTIYLPKAMAKNGGTVVGPFQITRGSLPSIEVTLNAANKAYTDISLGTLTLSSTTTLADFSRTVVANNPDYRYGDQISAFVATQRTNNVTGYPEVSVKSYEVTLGVEDETTKLYDIVAAMAFSVVDGKLGASTTLDGAMAWVHSRETNGSTLVSTQRLVVTNSLVANYSTNEAMTAAIDSYGGELSRDFLTPNGNADANANANVSGNANQGTTTYTLTVNGTPTEGGTVSGGGSYASGASANLAASPNTGYRFVSWNDGDTNATRTVTVTENKTYTATFATTSGGSGTGSGGQEQG